MRLKFRGVTSVLKILVRSKLSTKSRRWQWKGIGFERGIIRFCNTHSQTRKVDDVAQILPCNMRPLRDAVLNDLFLSWISISTLLFPSAVRVFPKSPSDKRWVTESALNLSSIPRDSVTISSRISHFALAPAKLERYIMNFSDAISSKSGNFKFVQGQNPQYQYLYL